MNSHEVRNSAKGDQGKDKHKKETIWEDIRILEGVKYFKVVLLDGETIEAKLLRGEQYHIEIETEKARILLPKHSVKYYILEEYAEEG